MKQETVLNLFAETNTPTVLVQHYVKNQNELVRRMALELAIPLLQDSTMTKGMEYGKNLALQFFNFGAVKQATTDLQTFSTEFQYNPSMQAIDGYIETVLKAMAEIARHDVGRDALLSPAFISCIQHCLSIDFLQVND